jgi:protein AaeX
LKFFEVNLLGVYVAPISILLVLAWLVTVASRRIASRFGLLRHVWHPALFVFSVYIIVLSSMVLIIAR